MYDNRARDSMQFRSKFEVKFETPLSSEIVEEVFEEVDTVKLDSENDSITELFWGSSKDKFKLNDYLSYQQKNFLITAKKELQDVSEEKHFIFSNQLSPSDQSFNIVTPSNWMTTQVPKKEE